MILRKNFNTRGITAIELLVVIAVIVIIFLTVLPQFSKVKENQVIKSGALDIVSSLNKARGQTFASVNSYSYGVHFQSDQVIVFKGIVYFEGAVDNESINIISPASITNVTLGGVSGLMGDVYFNRLSGTPNHTGTITVSTSSFSKIITISATGSFSIN